MRWWRFLFWNAAGGIVCATVFGLLAYYLGHAAIDMLRAYGFIGAVIIIVVAGVLISMRAWLRRRLERGER
jgi:membrane protein DedA with SNARE-associated domain